MRPDVVVVVAPQRQRSAGIGQAVEDRLIQALVAQAAVERLDVAVLLRMRRIRKQSGGLFSRRLARIEVVSYSPTLGQISGLFKLLPAPADRFQCC